MAGYKEGGEEEGNNDDGGGSAVVVGLCQGREQEGKRRAGVSRRAERRVRKHVKSIRSVLPDLDRLFSSLDDGDGTTELSITLGPSSASPREQYLLRFHGSTPPPPPPGQTEDATAAKAGTETTDERVCTEDDRLPRSNGAQTRTEREMAQWSVCNFLRGTSGEEHAGTFERRTGGGSGCRIDVAVLLT